MLDVKLLEENEAKKLQGSNIMLEDILMFKKYVKDMIDKIDDIELLRRIYALSEYLYINYK